MKNIYKNLILISTFLPFVAFAKSSLPAMLCIDAEEYWDGPFTIELGAEDEFGQVQVNVYAQLEEERLLLLKNMASSLDDEKYFGYKSEEFKLEIPKENMNFKSKNLTTIMFQYENNTIVQDYWCAYL